MNIATDMYEQNCTSISFILYKQKGNHMIVLFGKTMKINAQEMKWIQVKICYNSIGYF